MFVTNNMCNFEGRMRKHSNDFTMQQYYLNRHVRNYTCVDAGPLRQKWVKSLHPVYTAASHVSRRFTPNSPFLG